MAHAAIQLLDFQVAMLSCTTPVGPYTRMSEFGSALPDRTHQCRFGFHEPTMCNREGPETLQPRLRIIGFPEADSLSSEVSIKPWSPSVCRGADSAGGGPGRVEIPGQPTESEGAPATAREP